MDYGYVWYDNDQVVCLDDIQSPFFMRSVIENAGVYGASDEFDMPYIENNLYEMDAVA